MIEGSVPALSRVPIESLVRDMRRGRSYTLGLASFHSEPERTGRDWVTAIAQKCAEKTDRTAIVIRTMVEATAQEALDGDTNNQGGIACVHWTPWREPLSAHSQNGRSIHAELALLPKWRQQFSLVVIELGDIDGNCFAGLGKLCDGVALVASFASSNRIHRCSRILRDHQSNGIRVVGLWSTERP